MSTSEAETREVGGSRTTDILDSVRDNREMLSVLFYLFLVLVTSALLAPMLGRVWQKEGLSYMLLTLPVQMGLLSLPALSVLLITLWFGLVLLLILFDQKKRLQGVLLLAGSLVGIYGFCGMGLVCGNLNLFSNLEWAGIGLGVAFVMGGIQDVPRLLEDRKTEFRAAAQWIFYLGSILVTLIPIHCNTEVSRTSRSVS